MGSASEPPRHVNMTKWEATWKRIRANQAKQRAEAAAAELREAEPEPRVDDLSEEE